MISMQFNGFITALEEEVKKRNETFAAQGVKWEVEYPHIKENEVAVKCSHKKKHAMSTMTEAEFNMNISTISVEECVQFFVNLVTNKVRGDLMI